MLLLEFIKTQRTTVESQQNNTRSTVTVLQGCMCFIYSAVKNNTQTWICAWSSVLSQSKVRRSSHFPIRVQWSGKERNKSAKVMFTVLIIYMMLTFRRSPGNPFGWNNQLMILTFKAMNMFAVDRTATAKMSQCHTPESVQMCLN